MARFQIQHLKLRRANANLWASESQKLRTLGVHNDLIRTGTNMRYYMNVVKIKVTTAKRESQWSGILMEQRPSVEQV